MFFAGFKRSESVQCSKNHRQMHHKLLNPRGFLSSKRHAAVFVHNPVTALAGPERAVPMGRKNRAPPANHNIWYGDESGDSSL